MRTTTPVIAPGPGTDETSGDGVRPAELEPDLEGVDSLDWAARPGRRSTRERLRAGLRGLKLAMRGDSSFFAHAYRGLFIALAASLLGLDPVFWCLLILAAALVLIAELAHSAIEALARTRGDEQDPTLDVARDIATAGVLVAVVATVAIAAFGFSIRLGDLLSWW